MKLFFPILLTLLFLVSCHNDPPIVMGPTSNNNNNIKENLINANRTIAQAEETAIDQYISRRGWSMERLPEGARVWEYKNGKGATIAYEDSVCVEYSVEAINGKTIYNNLKDCFVAGRRQEMIGLDQAILHLHYGSSARVILPSALAYGIGGDGDRIPQSTILILDIKIGEK